MRFLQIILVIVIIVLGYLTFNSIYEPIIFKEKAKERIENTKQKLNDLAVLQQLIMILLLR